MMQLKNQQGGALLNALRECQKECGHLTPAHLTALAAHFNKSLAEVYETASFYSMLHFRPAGKYVIEICRSAPCHVAGAAQTIRALEEQLGIRMGETTADGQISLRFTECIGQCQNGPSVLVNGKLHANVTQDRVPELLEQIFREEV